MAATWKIAILLHERDRYPKSNGHFIWALCDLWREWGLKIELLRGVDQYVEADLLIPHLDTTVTPDAYLQFFEKYPRVLNRRLRDISKRVISRNLLSRGDSYDGPVIVKTDRNCGGMTDLAFRGPKIAFPGETMGGGNRLTSCFRRPRTSQNWAKINCIASNDYPIFPSLREVPEEIFANPALVVERLLPECEEGFYHIRYYLFLGDREYCWRLRSPNPVVKRSDVVRYEAVMVPDELRAMRRELDLDYGKLDFVIRDGQAVVLDVNRTPGVLGLAQDRKSYAAQLAPGLRTLL